MQKNIKWWLTRERPTIFFDKPSKNGVKIENGKWCGICVYNAVLRKAVYNYLLIKSVVAKVISQQVRQNVTYRRWSTKTMISIQPKADTLQYTR